MPPQESESRSFELAANGDARTQVERLERELRGVHTRLDGVLCAVESLLRSPAMTPDLESALFDVLEPASEAIGRGATRLRQRTRRRRSVAGW